MSWIVLISLKTRVRDPMEPNRPIAGCHIPWWLLKLSKLSESLLLGPTFERLVLNLVFLFLIRDVAFRINYLDLDETAGACLFGTILSVFDINLRVFVIVRRVRLPMIDPLMFWLISCSKLIRKE